MSRRAQVAGTVAVFAVFVVYDWLYWETLFTGLSSTPVSWLWFHGASAVMAACFVALFTRGWAGVGPKGGLRFGVVAGLFWSGSEFMTYALQPGVLSTTLGNAIGDIGMFALGGVVLGSIDHMSRARAV